MFQVDPEKLSKKQTLGLGWIHCILTVAVRPEKISVCCARLRKIQSCFPQGMKYLLLQSLLLQVIPGCTMVPQRNARQRSGLWTDVV